MNNYAIALGMYLVGLSTHVIAVKATVLPTPDVEIELGMPKIRGQLPDGWKGWERETRIHVQCTLRSLGIDIGFSISFDSIPASNAKHQTRFAKSCNRIGDHDSNVMVVDRRKNLLYFDLACFADPFITN